MDNLPALCPPNITIHNIWINHGVSQCFLDTLSSSIMAGFILFFGTIQLIIYRKHATRVESVRLRSSMLYKLQHFLLLLMAVATMARLYVQFKYFGGIQIYGYMILHSVLMFFAYLYSACLVSRERHYQLPAVPARGHGFVLLLFFTMTAIEQNLALINIHSSDWWFEMKDKRERMEMTFFVIRYIGTLFLFVLALKAPGISSIAYEDDESTLINEQNDQNSGSTFRNGWKKLKTLMPFLWPKKSFQLQCQVIFCIFLLFAGRFVNVYVPIYNKKIVDALAAQEFPSTLIWTYVGMKLLQGGGTGTMGILNNLRSFLWIRIQQYTSLTIEIELFRHLHSLSLKWHLGRKTGEVLRIMDRGTDSISNLLNYLIFQIFPTIADIFIAVVFLISAFNWKFGAIVFLTMAAYIASTIAITEWRTKYQRSMNLADNATRARSVDSLLNFETVKYYGAEGYEVDCYREAILKYQDEEFKSVSTLNMLNTAQNVIVCVGLLIGSLLCAWMVVYGEAADRFTVGDYVLFSTYIIQLYMPLNWIGTYYRQIQKNFVDMENMFDLMKEEQEIIDAPGAPDLSVVRGGIDFSNVTFGYSPEKIILSNVTFNIAPGKTVALVGPSGAGKSTIMRLLFRFYDVTNGAIMIDGQNVKTVTQKSLRKAIGVVPQDTVLFNETIKYNIRYARINAPDADVINAARNADIHEKILTMPQQYETPVGERGLRLSGGEKQRVAIARTILKGPQIVLLDEATSALDTQTERNIQAALSRVCANKTTLIIAHRLSTIIHADEILVLKDGEIVERGRHDQLLEDGGLYCDMWNQQLKNLEGEKARDEQEDKQGGSQSQD